MIPKIIHYCWFGGKPLPELAKQCIRSWKKYCPDFEIKEWNESNSPLHLFPFVEEAVKAKKWAFVSDVIRLYALATEGGIYMDTDVELLKPLESFCIHHAFSGYERDSNKIQTAIMGAEPNAEWVLDNLSIYKKLHFDFNTIYYQSIINNYLLSDLLASKGLILDGKYYESDYVTIYPKDYFCPMSCGSHFIEKNENTVCIHYYSFSWADVITFKQHLRKQLIALLGEKRFRTIVNSIRKIRLR